MKITDSNLMVDHSKDSFNSNLTRSSLLDGVIKQSTLLNKTNLKDTPFTSISSDTTPFNQGLLENEPNISKSYLSAGKEASTSLKKNLDLKNVPSPTSITHTVTDESQYFSMITHTLIVILLFIYSVHKLSRKSDKENSSNQRTKFGKSKLLSMLTKLFYLLSVISTVALLCILININLPIKYLEKGNVTEKYEIKISKEYLDIMKVTKEKINGFKETISTMLFPTHDLSKKGSFLDEKKNSTISETKEPLDDKMSGNTDTEKKDLDYTNKSYASLSLTPLINILFSLSHILLISSILLLTTIKRLKKKELFLSNKKPDDSLRYPVIAYALLRIPLLIFLDFTGITRNSTSRESVNFIKSVYYGMEGYVTAGLVFLHITVLYRADKHENENESGIILADTESKELINYKNIEKESENKKSSLYFLLFSLIIYTFLKHTLQILSLPVTLNQTFFYVLNRIEDLCWVMICLGILGGTTE